MLDKKWNPELFGVVAVLMGGTSAEREISLMGGKRVLASLKEAGVRAIGLDAKENWIQAIHDFKVDRVFIVLHGPGGEDGRVQAVLDQMKIPYTGSGILGCAITLDKQRTKWIFQALNIPTPAFELLEPGFSSKALVQRYGLPVIIKPVSDGSSLGVSKVEKESDIAHAYEDARRYSERVMIEQFIDGDEYTVGILNNEPLPAVRIKVAPHHAFYDYEAKYFDDSTQYDCPCGLPKDDEKKLQQWALQGFLATGCEGWGRVDAMRDKKGQFWLLEINPIPGFTEHSLVPMAAHASGIGFDHLVLTILKRTLPIYEEYKGY